LFLEKLQLARLANLLCNWFSADRRLRNGCHAYHELVYIYYPIGKLTATDKQIELANLMLALSEQPNWKKWGSN